MPICYILDSQDAEAERALSPLIIIATILPFVFPNEKLLIILRLRATREETSVPRNSFEAGKA